VRSRIELTRGLVAEHAVIAERVQTIGESRIERLVSLVLLGDLVSLYLAALDGVDPATIESIRRLKAAMQELEA
jgi:glucose/mannose-6-phosphate isomerase